MLKNILEKVGSSNFNNEDLKVENQFLKQKINELE